MAEVILFTLHPVFLPGESQGWGTLVGCRLWGRTGGSIVGLMVTCSKETYDIPRSTAPRAPDPAAVHC